MSGGVQANAFALAIENVRSGRIRLDPIVTHNIPLREYRRAVDIAHQRLEHAIKVSMTP